jgi:hypothetical protein
LSFTKEVWVALPVGIFATTWFITGGVRDIIYLFRKLKTLKPDFTDNGMVAPQAAVEAEAAPVLTSPTQLATEQKVTEMEDAGDVALRNK